MKHRSILVGFVLLLFASLCMSLYRPSSASAADTYTLHDNSNESSINITGPLVPGSPKQVTFTWWSKGEYHYIVGDPGNGNGHSCEYMLETTNGQDRDTSGKIVPIGFGNDCGAASGKSYDITIATSSGPGQPGPTGAAAQKGTWVNHSTITSNGVTYRDPKIDDTLGFQAVDGKDCASKNFIDSWPNKLNGNDTRNATLTATIHMFAGKDLNTCTEQDTSITFDNPTDPETGSDAYDIYFWWQDAGTISSTDYTDSDASIIFVQNKAKEPYYGTLGRAKSSDSADCHASSITASGGGDTTGTLVLTNDNLNNGWPNYIFNAGHDLGSNSACLSSKGLRVIIGGGVANGHKSAGSSTLTTSLTNQVSGTPTDSCESLDSALTWIMCPVIKLLDNSISSLDSVINSQLRSPDYGQQGIDKRGIDNSNLKTAWGRLRNIALIVLIPIMLVMVFGTAIGFGGLDAYTVKRAMPRLLIAILFISLSWYITIFLVNFTNVIAQGLLGLITQPFGVANKSLIDFIRPSTGLGATGAVGVGALLLLGRVDLAIAFSAVGVAAIALFAAFLVLVIRQILILALIMLAPLAILSWIFPNNNDLWKLWWGTFSKLLLMYPIIILLIGAGKIGASIIPDQQGSNGPFTQLLVLSAYVIPYFLIPATFKFAGGVLANFAGVINDRSRGFFDKQRKFRQEHSAELKKRSGAGFRFNPNNPLINRMSKSNNKLIRRLNPNRLGEWSASPYKAAAYYGRNKKIPLLSQRGKFIASEVEHEQWEQSMKFAQQLNGAIGSNDKAYRVLGGLHDGLTQATIERLRDAGLYGRALTSEKDVNAAADIMAQSQNHTEIEAASALRRAAPVIGHKYRDNEMNYASVAAAAAVGLGMHGFHIGRDMSQMGRNITAETGNAEFADSALVQVELAGARSNPWAKAGYGHQFNPNTGEFLNAFEAERDLDVMGTLGPQDVAGAKGSAMDDERATYDYIIDNSDVNPEVLEQRISTAQGRVVQAEAKAKEAIRAQNPSLSESQVEARIDQTPDVQTTRAQARDEIDEVNTQLSAVRNGQTAGAQAQQHIDALVDQEVATLQAANPNLSDGDARRQAREVVRYNPANRVAWRMAQAHSLGETVKQQHLFSVASRISYASADIKGTVLDIINSHPDLKREFDYFEGRINRGDADAIAMVQLANQGAAAAQQAQMPGAPQPQPPAWQGPTPGGQP